MHKQKLILVEWDDACSYDPWQEAKDLDLEPKRCITVGFLCRETKTAIFVAGSVSEEDVCCVMQIPRKMIKTIKPLSWGKTK